MHLSDYLCDVFSALLHVWPACYAQQAVKAKPVQLSFHCIQPGISNATNISQLLTVSI